MCMFVLAHTHRRTLWSLCSLTSYSQLSSLLYRSCPHLSTCTAFLNITFGLFDAKYTEGFSALIFFEPSVAFEAVDTVFLNAFFFDFCDTVHSWVSFLPLYSQHPTLFKQIFFLLFIPYIFSIFLSSALIPLLLSLYTL